MIKIVMMLLKLKRDCYHTWLIEFGLFKNVPFCVFALLLLLLLLFFKVVCFLFFLAYPLSPPPSKFLMCYSEMSNRNSLQLFSGWERMVLQILFLGPSNLLEPTASFEQMSQKLIVSPIVRTLVFSKVPEKVCILQEFMDCCLHIFFCKLLPCEHMFALQVPNFHLYACRIH